DSRSAVGAQGFPLWGVTVSQFIPETIVQTGRSTAEERLSALQLRMLVRTDQFTRWRNGERVLAEIYLQRYPALAEDADGLLDVLLREILLRRSQGEQVDLEEYAHRFPDYAVSLRDCANPEPVPLVSAPTTMRPLATGPSTREIIPPSQVAATLNAPADLVSGEQPTQPSTTPATRRAVEGETVPGYVL